MNHRMPAWTRFLIIQTIFSIRCRLQRYLGMVRTYRTVGNGGWLVKHGFVEWMYTGKEFVDMPAKLPIDKVWDNWEKLAENANVTDEQLKAFVEENFGEPGWELQGYEPEGWVEVPKYLDGIKGAGLRHICLSIQTLWKTLGKRVKPEVVK